MLFSRLPISVTTHANHRSQCLALHLFVGRLGPLVLQLLLLARRHLQLLRVHLLRLTSPLICYAENLRTQVLVDCQRDQMCGVVPELGVSLHETHAVHVADVGRSPISQQIEPTNELLEQRCDLSAYLLLVVCEKNRIANLLSVLVTIHLPVDRGTLPRLRVDVGNAHRVHLYVGAFGLEESLVDVAAVRANVGYFRIVMTRLVAALAEQFLHPATICARVVNTHVMVFRVHGLFDKGLLQLHACGSKQQADQTVENDVLVVLLKVSLHISLLISLHQKVIRNLDSL